MIVFTSIVLCQYVGCCGSHGTARFFLTNLVPVAVGVGWVSVVNHGVLPQFASTTALDKLGTALEQCAQLMNAHYDAFIQVDRQACNATCTLHVSKTFSVICSTALHTLLVATCTIRARVQLQQKITWISMQGSHAQMLDCVLSEFMDAEALHRVHDARGLTMHLTGESIL